MPQLIGIAGLKTSGKDTTCQYIQRTHGGRVERAAFADKLKIMAARALGFDRPDEELIDLMNEAKETWIINIARNLAPLGEDWMGETLMATHFHALSGREYLQWFGGNARKVFGDTFWVDQVLPRPTIAGADRDFERKAMADRYPDADLVVVTDVRYPNEARRVLDLGGVVWEVWRPGLNSDGHDSEQPLPRELIDWTVNNNGSFEDLEREVKRGLEFTL